MASMEPLRLEPTLNTPVDLSEVALADAVSDEVVMVKGLRWCEMWGRWMEWDGTVWRQDRTVSVYDRVRMFIKECACGLDQKEKRRLCSASSVSAIERLARCDRRAAAVPEDFDPDPWFINTKDGMVELKTGNPLPHDPLFFMTKITAVGVGGTCPGWLEFLRQVTDDDVELQAFLQRVAGYCLTGSTREHAFIFFWGTGGNGKGVFLNTLRGLLGDYAKVAPIETFTESKNDRHPTELAMPQGARLVIAQETEEGRRWSEAKIKTLTGGDPISARFMRRDFFEYVPAFKLVIAGNHKPALATVDEAIRRRLLLVPFNITIPPDQRDPDLADKLRSEWPGILQWAIEGCQNYLEVGLCPPKTVRVATDEYFEDQDTFKAWITEKCELGREHWEATSLLFESWRNFADENGFPAGSQKALAARLESNGFTKDRDRARGRHWLGIRVRK